MGLPEVLHDLRLFHRVAPPEEPEEYKVAGTIVKGLTYVALLATLVSPVGIVYGAMTENALLLMASLGAIPSFVVLAMSYPAFVQGERWALAGVLLVAGGIALLTPLRFFTEAAAVGAFEPAHPPTVTEIVVFLAAFLLIYVLLLPETREGMRKARSETRRARGEAATAAAATRTPYACPSCGRLYHLRTLPAPGTACPSCRHA